MSENPQVIPCEQTITRLSAATPAVAGVHPGHPVRFETSDIAYRSMTGSDIDAGHVDFRDVNQLTGPVFIDGAMPGDALGFSIERIGVGPTAYVPFVSRWRSRLFPVSESSVDHYSIRDGVIEIDEHITIHVRPMVGCFATAPGTGTLSSLSPAGKTGGNLDLPEAREGATIWLPVEVPGALFVLGDLHASMGRSEPFGAGLECGGAVIGRFRIAAGIMLPGPRIESVHRIHFVGSDPSNDEVSIQLAIQSGWNWLVYDCGLTERTAKVICAAELNVTMGGPAGSNHVASFDVVRLRAQGITAPLLIDTVNASETSQD